jgi:3-hydroxyisobutyrate dehydrogenase-like beta-hydroxyacid dehydrogenase
MQGKRSLFLGAVGAGARMKLVVNMTMGSMMGERGLLG